MKTVSIVFASVIIAACGVSLLVERAPAGATSDNKDWPGQDWANYVRIGAYGLRGGDALEIVRRAQESGVFGIEVDNDIPGR